MAKEVSKSIGYRIKERRESLGLSQKDLAKLLDISYGAIGNYESGVSSPREDIMLNLFNILKCDANYLFQDVVDLKKEYKLSGQEYSLIEKYRSLTPRGKETVDTVLNLEYKREKENIIDENNPFPDDEKQARLAAFDEGLHTIEQPDDLPDLDELDKD